MEIRFWIDPETDLPHIFQHGGPDSEGEKGVSETPKEEAPMKKKKQKFPAGWDETRVSALANHYETQSEDEQVAEHEAAFVAENQTVMVVPTDMVPKIVKLIHKRRIA
ncbi:MAG TPA: hypothetical protein VGL71_09005 [Urbifossiella sp.]|jgi:hypothetical protein